MTMRWNEEQLAEFEKRRAGWDKTGQVRTHMIQPPPAPKAAPEPKRMRPTVVPPLPEVPPLPKIAARPKKVRRPRVVSEIEALLAQQIGLLQELSKPEREYKHIHGRDFRLDFAWPDRRIGVEVQGMVHRIKGRFKNDIEKRALGLLAGWRVLEVGGAEIRSGVAIAWLLELMPLECDHIWLGDRCQKCQARC